MQAAVSGRANACAGHGRARPERQWWQTATTRNQLSPAKQPRAGKEKAALAGAALSRGITRPTKAETFKR